LAKQPELFNPKENLLMKREKDYGKSNTGAVGGGKGREQSGKKSMVTRG